ncbi:MAG: ATP-binding protein, partial [Gemmatimonadales bacterium]
RVESDRETFLDAIEQVDFERAIELYRGHFLPGFAAPGSADFEHWADLERYRLRLLFERAAEQVVRDWLSRGRLRKAKDLAARARDAEPENESAWRLLLETLLAANDRVGAELEAQALERILAHGDRPPEPATRTLLTLVRQQTPEAEPEPTRRSLVAELIGREREFSNVVAAWDAARRGPGCHVHVVGAPGLGKTRLLADLHARLRAMGAGVAQLRANPGGRHVPYALAAELALALAKLPGAAAVSPAAAGALVALNPRLSAQYAAPADRAADLEALRRREIALEELLAAVADEQPVALLVDDLHWADAESRQVVDHLLTTLSAHRILAVTSARPGPEAALVAAAADQLALNPLSDSEVGALVTSLGALPGAPWAEGLPSRLHTATNGSPLLILETLRLALEREWLALRDGCWDCTDPAALGAELARGGALRRRIEELSGHERAVLRLLSAAGTPLEAKLIVGADGREEAAVLTDLAALELRGLVVRDGGDWQPVHDEIAARALEAARPEELGAAHRAIGRVLAASAGQDAALLYR